MLVSEVHPYQRGFLYDTMPIPMVPEHCVPVEAGPVTFIVESRLLTNEILLTDLPEGAVDLAGTTYDDFGATVHVCDPGGTEYLRFDCFEHDPHYHYLMQDQGQNLVSRIDEVAEGDPMEWTLGRLRTRLAPMLELAGAAEVARAVTRAGATIDPAVDAVADLLRQAQIVASRRHDDTVDA